MDWIFFFENFQGLKGRCKGRDFRVETCGQKYHTSYHIKIDVDIAAGVVGNLREQKYIIDKFIFLVFFFRRYKFILVGHSVC